MYMPGLVLAALGVALVGVGYVAAKAFIAFDDAVESAFGPD